MNQPDRRLRRDIVLVVILKIIAMTALWAWFVRDARVPADAAATAEHLGVAAPAVTPRQLPGVRHAD